MKKNSPTSKTVKPMFLSEYSEVSESMDYPVYLQRRFHGIRALYSKGKFKFEEEVKVRSNEEFLSFYKLDLDDKETVILDGYFICDKGDTPSKRQQMKSTLENPGKSMRNVCFIVYDGFFQNEPDLCYEQRLIKVIDICSKANFPNVNTTMSVRANSYNMLIHYYRMLTAGRESGNGVFMRTTKGVYTPGLVSTQTCVVSNSEPKFSELGRELVAVQV